MKCEWCNQEAELYYGQCTRCYLAQEVAPTSGRNRDYSKAIQYRAFQALWTSKYRIRPGYNYKHYEKFFTRELLHKRAKRQISNKEHFINCILATDDISWREAQQDNPERIKEWEELYGSAIY